MVRYLFLAASLLAAASATRAQSLQNYGTLYPFTTFAGSGSSGSANGNGTAAEFNGPDGIAVDASGNVYVADGENDTIRKITSGGSVSTLAGTAGSAGSSDGLGAAARFNGPGGLAVDSSGNVYVADTGNSTIREIAPNGQVTTIAGTAGTTGLVNGSAGTAEFSSPTGVAVDSSGNVYVADTLNGAIRKIASGVVTTLSVPGLGQPTGVALDGAGNLYVCDALACNVRMITPAGAVTILAGQGTAGDIDAIGEAAQFATPQGLAADAAGNVYVADTYNFAVRRIAPDGTVTTLAGQLGAPVSADGTSEAAAFNFLSGIAVGSNEHLYVSDSHADLIRVGTPPNQPIIIAQPAPATATGGGAVSLTVAFIGASPVSVQWYKNGTAISGATAATFTLPSVQLTDDGSYTVVLTNSSGTTTSHSATLAVAPSAQTPATAYTQSSLVNLSARANAGTETNSLIVGFVVGGSSNPDAALTVLLRGIGPTLAQFGVTGVLSNPLLTLTSNATGAILGTNSGWGGSTSLAQVFAQVGAFALPAGSADAAIESQLTPGSWSEEISAADSGGSGVALGEIYTVNPTLSPRLVDISARANVGSGTSLLIGGFVISGNTPETVLVRGVGPGLFQYLSGDIVPLSQPQLVLYDAQGNQIAANGGWGGNPTLASAFAEVGAFSLPPNSDDCALLVTLPPGNYSAEVSGANSTTGIALVEIYEVP